MLLANGGLELGLGVVMAALLACIRLQTRFGRAQTSCGGMLRDLLCHACQGLDLPLKHNALWSQLWNAAFILGPMLEGLALSG